MQEVRISVRLTPRASRNEIAGYRDKTLMVRVTSPPVDDAANRALCRLLAKQLGIARGKVEITAGERSRDKTVRVQGLTTQEIRERLGTNDSSP